MHPSKVLLLASALVAVSGCATKTYVDESLAEMESRVDARLDDHDARLTELTATSQQALARAEDAGVLARGKFLYSVVLTEEGITFDTAQSSLSDGAKRRLASLADELKADNRNVYLEIQGHTDATGDPAYNQWLGQQRADAAHRYLHDQGVALDRMATISYGEDAPLADNGTADGRAKNRRVEVVVLE